MYDVKPNLIIAFHGCDADICKALLNNPNHVKISRKPYDWLGHGMYFWENNYDRALQWANDKKKRGEINKPAVIGALLQPGYCCDFTETKYIQVLRNYYDIVAERYRMVERKLPENKDLPHDRHKDKILRELDCAIIEFMHIRILERRQADVSEKGFTGEKLFDSTRGVFTEGGPAFDGAGLFAKTHIQICIRNLNCIKGFFLPRQEIDFQHWLETNMLKV